MPTMPPMPSAVVSPETVTIDDTLQSSRTVESPIRPAMPPEA